MWGAIGAVFSSWMNQRAITYRRLNNHSRKLGHRCQRAGNGVRQHGRHIGDRRCLHAQSLDRREPELYGEFLVNAQGEDVVAGIRTPQNITEVARIGAGSDAPSMEKVLPDCFAEFVRATQLLEKHYRDMQDMEFTVERGKLWMLQTRNGKRTAKAALRIAVDMANEGSDEQGGSVSPRWIRQRSINCCIQQSIPDAERKIIATGLPASPGAARGEIVFSADEAEALKAAGHNVILVRVETSPEDIHGMHAAEGILTTRGGMTSHAAVVARGMGKPCVSGAGSIRVDYASRR